MPRCRIAGHRLESGNIVPCDLCNLFTTDHIWIVVNMEFQTSAILVEHEGCVGRHVVGLKIVSLPKIQVSRLCQLPEHMKMDKIECSFEQLLSTLHLLDLG